MLYTKHTKEVGQNIFQHGLFACKLCWITGTSSFFFFLHAISGGLIQGPKKYQLSQLSIRLLFINKDLKRKKLECQGKSSKPT